MLEAVKQLYHHTHKNDVFIVGGGPSVKEIDLDKLKGKKIIAVNNAYKLFSELTAIYWADGSWADQHHKGLDQHSCQLRFHSRNKPKLDDKHKGPYGCTVLKKTGDYGYDPEPHHVRGNNSGVQALNLIINMKPKRIFLLGFDMRRIDNKTHWHDDHILQVPSDVYTDMFIPSINSLAEELKNYNTPDIINCSLYSAVRCFKIDDFNNYF